ncbi:MAG: glycosyltransferase family 4 protein [Chloroflexi bacterium]|nr:glycosyltransferase family 4 protein [Chloroflexota bacterium]
MRVGLNAHLLSLTSSYRGAGISRYIWNLINHLGRVSQSERYVLFLGDPKVASTLMPDDCFGLRLSSLPTVRPLLRILWEQLLQPLALLQEHIDVLHSLGYVQPILCASRSVVTVHDLSFLLYPRIFNRLNRLYLSVFTYLSTRRADKVIAVSENTKRDLIRLLNVPADKIVVIGHGVEESFRPLAESEVAAFRERQGLPAAFILFVGTLEPRKNISTLLKAYAQLRRESHLPHKLVIAGAKGWLYERIFTQARELGLQDDVLFPGYIALDQLPLWYNCADLFVYPSLYEGFGFPPLEAMACGTPLVCSQASSLPEVVGEVGVLVDPLAVEEWAGAMVKVLSEPALRWELRQKGLARARLFSWEGTARRTLEAYRSLGSGVAASR